MELQFELSCIRMTSGTDPLQCMGITVYASIQGVQGLEGKASAQLHPHHVGLSTHDFFLTPEGQALKVKAQAALLNSIARVNRSMETAVPA